MKRFADHIKDNGKLRVFFDENKDMIIKVAAIAVVIVVAFFAFAPGTEDGEDEVVAETEAVTEAEPAGILVDIGGAVNEPMVAELEEGSRVEDAIKAAGGLTEDADVSGINRAAFVEDGEKIFVPSLIAEDADGQQSGTSSGAAYYSDGKININTADSPELQELDGIGPVTAEKIIDYREENGRFDTIEDIKNVSGIGDKTFEKLKDDIRV